MKELRGYIAVTNKDRHKSLKEEFSGEVLDIQERFPVKLGAKHPFNFEDAEKLYKKYGTLGGMINKIADSVVTDFKVKLQNPNAQVIIDGFIRDTNLHAVLREWVREAVLKGNGFIELDLEEARIRIMNANNMYVKRNKKGKVLEYRQWTRPFKKFSLDATDLIKFKPGKIAHLPLNKIPNDPYGIGFVWPNERIIQNIILNEQDLQTVTSRKAGSPYHIKVGQPGKITPKSVVDQVKSNLQYLTNTHEWVTDADVDIKSISFPDAGKNLTDAELYFFRMLLAGMEVPEVLMGSGQLNEGIAQVQLKAYGRKINSIQNQVADIIEEKIITPILLANGLDDTPLFIWDLPDQDEINKRVEQINTLINNMSISAGMKARLEIELAELLEYDDIENVLISPEDAEKEEQLRKEEEKQDRETERVNREREHEETKIPQPEVPKAKPAARQSIKHDITESNTMSVQEFVNLKEIAGFNYTDYLIEIIKQLQVDPFTDLKALTAKDVADGLLKESDIEKLRQTLKDGFRNNKTIREIEKDIQRNLNLKNRITKTGGVIAAKHRPNIIARTETVRVANEGLINLYKANNIEKVSWVAALSDRTCPICDELNGQVWEIDKAPRPPAHVNCRCSLISVVE